MTKTLTTRSLTEKQGQQRNSIPQGGSASPAPALHEQYGSIGIPAVAAAARYQSAGSDEQTPQSYPDERFEETGN